MKKKLRKFKKYILSHQVEAIIVLISIAICIIGSIAVSPLCIPIIIVIDLVFLNIDKFKSRVKVKEEDKTEILGELVDNDIKDDFELIVDTIDEKKKDNYIENKIEGEPNMKKKEKKTKVHKEKKTKKKKRIFKWLLIIILSFIIIGIIGAGIFWKYIVDNAPEFSEDKLYKKESTILYDKNGEEFAKLGSEFREMITYDQLPEVLVNAIIATEDSRFFQHNGFDLPRFAKASVQQVLSKLFGIGGNAGGASTLTMQISKNAFTSTESEGIEGIIRKFTDIYVAINEIEKNYSKEEIIEFYVNSYCLGGNIYGVEQASVSYFGKHAKDLNLAEAAIIAGLFQAPNKYSPVSNPENAAYRRGIVLKLMVKHGYITQEEADAANNVPVESLVVENFSYASNNVYQGFIDTVVSEIKQDTGYNAYTTPMEVYTTLDPKKQDVINDAMSGKIYNWENELVNAGISVIDSKTGELVAVGTGRDTSGIGLLNHATFENQTKRQIGSTAKPIYDYAAAIEFLNMSPAYYIGDEPYKYTSGQDIYDWDEKYAGLINLRYALSDSRNIPALKLFQKVTKAASMVKYDAFVNGFGMTPDYEGDPNSHYVHEAHSIGGYNGQSPVEMSAAYATFANGGVYNEPHSYTKLIYRETGEELVKDFRSEQIMKDSTAFIVYDMLISTAQHAMYNYANINGWTYGAKTGTTNFTKEAKQANHLADNAVNDLWVNATTDEYTISVWYGYDKINTTYYTRFGNMNQLALINTIAKRIWTRTSNIPQPDSVVKAQYELYSVDEPKAPSENTPAGWIGTEYFVKGTEPSIVSDRFTTLTNPKNFQGSYSNGTVTLTWTGIEEPWQTSKDGWKNYFKNMYTSSIGLEEASNGYYGVWKNSVGELTYDIYEKVDDEWVYVTSSAILKDEENPNNNTGSVDIDIDSSANDKSYLIKTSWSKYDGCDSSGSVITVKISGSAAVVKAVLIGDSTETITEGESFKKSIQVLSNGTDVTSASTISVIITNSENKNAGNSLTAISSLKAGTYTIKYTATYKGTVKSISRTLIIKEASN